MANSCKKWWPEKDVVIGRIHVVSHHLRSLLGAIELIVSFAFLCRVGYFDAQIKETYYTSRAFDLLATLRKYN
jgi:hypothetical protein